MADSFIHLKRTIEHCPLISSEAKWILLTDLADFPKKLESEIADQAEAIEDDEDEHGEDEGV
jgi:hypothetical protein